MTFLLHANYSSPLDLEFEDFEFCTAFAENKKGVGSKRGWGKRGWDGLG